MADFRSWKVDFQDQGTLASKQLAPPPGFDNTARLQSSRGTSAVGGDVTVSVTRQQREAAAVNQALGAFKSVGMLAFMMWMSGSQLHIFSIMSTMSGLFQPISAILSSGKAFKTSDPETDTLKAQILFCMIQGLGITYALYKLNGMGLLPTHVSDFASYFTAPTHQEYSSGVIL
mmetsp:Transcript_9444/g.28425  ORF Transcript_9444/g.28425 Transcript_9444/m.28425 type:complete len:174 (-) Transcript_9444:433-954(-)|eukprot:CAMPEP_0206140484 /NCGR_PEP_ID=MMETSP1473-20131121/9595_1 /ASSEMBLY_ACC=CAM_ASM_001109 /TAXON_ID=1461547 /ORGANISM="Stichococcus sp, Strain RCC1054" /LENGTH=173 /DNA_ID=CAMNT_0053534643 /DNA_START=162 /DNA_END=683 /DNA_ORIENTATION=-